MCNVHTQTQYTQVTTNKCQQNARKDKKRLKHYPLHGADRASNMSIMSAAATAAAQRQQPLYYQVLGTHFAAVQNN